MVQCYICGESLNEPSKCILCEEYVCQEHSRSFEVGHEKSEGSERKLYAYVCDRCMEIVEELKRKPREEWTEEDKTKSKGMIGKIITALGKAGLAIITAIFAFALWLFAKGEKESDELNQVNLAIGQADANSKMPNESTSETSFAEETEFKEEEEGVAI